ncbi:MAG TPA: hypothetical protein VLK33_21120 [Terriglobales bacterium]|nr:hypothetical protein [Terriglobales bacterium]
MRALYWDGDLLYASRGYELLQGRIDGGSAFWETVGRYEPEWWRKISSVSRLGYRLFRDGFHALAKLPTGHLIAAVPKAIVTLAPGEIEFRVAHKVLRGTRPLHIAYTPDGRIYWGEYFNNPQRDEVHIYGSADHGQTWNVAYTFPKGTIRHVHNIVYDEWENCLWVLTGDNGAECRILKVSCDFRSIEEVISGNQQARAVAFVPTKDTLFFSSDTPFETNYIYGLERHGNLRKLTGISSSSICGCRVGDAVFFSTMIEPTEVNRDKYARLNGSVDGQNWQSPLAWRKDIWPQGLFQFGNILLPDGSNTTNVLALTTVAVKKDDLQTSLWRIEPVTP